MNAVESSVLVGTLALALSALVLVYYLWVSYSELLLSHKDMASKHNILVGKMQEIIEKHNNMHEAHNKLNDTYMELAQAHNTFVDKVTKHFDVLKDYYCDNQESNIQRLNNIETKLGILSISASFDAKNRRGNS